MFLARVRLLLTIRSRLKAARVAGEAIAWHHGARGVAEAKAAARDASGTDDEQLHRKIVAIIAEECHQALCEADTTARYSLAEKWARRPGQMIGLNSSSRPAAGGQPALPTSPLGRRRPRTGA